jgi:hypothetical protein
VHGNRNVHGAAWCAAIMDNQAASPLVYTSGNVGNGGNPQPDGIVIGAGTQILAFANTPLVAQSPGDPTPVITSTVSGTAIRAPTRTSWSRSPISCQRPVPAAKVSIP